MVASRPRSTSNRCSRPGYMHLRLHLTRPLLLLDSPDCPEALGASSCAMQLYERFRPGEAPPKSLGPSRDYNVDMVPKFIMNSGELVRGPCMRCPCETCTPCLSARRMQQPRRHAWCPGRVMLLTPCIAASLKRRHALHPLESPDKSSC